MRSQPKLQLEFLSPETKQNKTKNQKIVICLKKVKIQKDKILEIQFTKQLLERRAKQGKKFKV